MIEVVVDDSKDVDSKYSEDFPVLDHWIEVP